MILYHSIHVLQNSHNFAEFSMMSVPLCVLVDDEGVLFFFPEGDSFG